jgi:hypothetical protein
MIGFLLLSILCCLTVESYELPVYGCAVRNLNTYSKCVYIPGYFGINFMGAKCVTYNVDDTCMCIGDEDQCYPSTNCTLYQEDCFWDWRGGKEECEKINGPMNRNKCSRNEWLMPLNQPGECTLRKVTQPKCKVNIRPIYYEPYEIYECITESYSANCTYEQVCIPTAIVPKQSVKCKGCFIDKQDLLNRCEREGIPNDEVYECSDNQGNVISGIVDEEEIEQSEGISQMNLDECLINSSHVFYPLICFHILIIINLI